MRRLYCGGQARQTFAATAMQVPARTRTGLRPRWRGSPQVIFHDGMPRKIIVRRRRPRSSLPYLVVDPEYVGYVNADFDDVDVVDEGQLELGVGRRKAEVPVAAALAVVGRRRRRVRMAAAAVAAGGRGGCDKVQN